MVSCGNRKNENVVNLPRKVQRTLKLIDSVFAMLTMCYAILPGKVEQNLLHKYRRVCEGVVEAVLAEKSLKRLKKKDDSANDSKPLEKRFTRLHVILHLMETFYFSLPIQTMCCEFLSAFLQKKPFLIPMPKDENHAEKNEGNVNIRILNEEQLKDPKTVPRDAAEALIQDESLRIITPEEIRQLFFYTMDLLVTCNQNFYDDTILMILSTNVVKSLVELDCFASDPKRFCEQRMLEESASSLNGKVEKYSFLEDGKKIKDEILRNVCFIEK